MSVPLLLLVIPVVMAAITYAVRRWLSVQVLLAASTSAILVFLTFQIPLDTAVVVAGRDLIFRSTWEVLGRSLVFAAALRPALAFIFVAATVFFIGAGATRVSPIFLPAGLAMLSLLAATLFIQPFLFAALFLEMIAALAVLMLVDEQSRQTGGALRLLVFVTLGVPFFLLAGWTLEAYAASPEDPTLVGQGLALISIGFLILLGVVPFHSWIPAVAEEAPAFATAFVFTVVQAAIVFYLLNFLNQFEWMRNTPVIYSGLRIAGLSMVVVGGVFAFGQTSLGRLMGYTMLIDLGAGMLALGLGTAEGVRTALAIVALRGVALTVWGLGMGLLKPAAGGDDFEKLNGLGFKMPFATAAVIFGGLSLVGLPVTAGFAGRWALYQLLAIDNLTAVYILLAASISAMLAYARAVAQLLQRDPRDDEDPWAERPRLEGYILIGYASLGVIAILMLGIFPQMLLPAITAAADAFSALVAG